MFVGRKKELEKLQSAYLGVSKAVQEKAAQPVQKSVSQDAKKTAQKKKTSQTSQAVQPAKKQAAQVAQKQAVQPAQKQATQPAQKQAAQATHKKAAQTFQLAVIYGRRRVGKTALIAQFSKEKPTIFFTATEDSSAANLRNLSREYYAFEHPNADPSSAPIFESFQAAFEAIFSLAKNKRLIFVIDEFPYLAQAENSVSSVLQMLIDRNKDTSKLFLILCGSSLSFMKEQVLSQKSPLFGRRTAQFEIKPMDYFEARDFFPDVSAEESAQYYGLVGGVPLYLRQFDPKLSFDANVEQVFLDTSSLLFEEPTNLVKQEIRKAAAYNSVLSAIAQGKTTHNEIANACGVNTAEITYYLKELQNIGLIRREEPILPSSRRGLYKLNDNLFAFWYRFILPAKSLIERDMQARVLKQIKRHLSEYMGFVFEQICIDWLWRKNAAKTLGFEFDNAGRWWGSNPKKKQEEEIDIVCVADDVPIAVAECKYRDEAIDLREAKRLFSVLDERAALIGVSGGAFLADELDQTTDELKHTTDELKHTTDERSHKIASPSGANAKSVSAKGVRLLNQEKVHRYLFSKNGFDAACYELIKEHANYHLVSLEEMAYTL